MSDRPSDPKGFNESVIREFRANSGVVGGELAGMHLLLLTTLDARDGCPRTTPLAYHRRGDRYLVIASNGGAPRHPKWFRSLEQDPTVTVEIGVETFRRRRESSTVRSATRPSQQSLRVPRRPARSRRKPAEQSR